ncbi:MAG: hypothetical protein QM783_15870 [Phycisphaerales bacterium]
MRLSASGASHASRRHSFALTVTAPAALADINGFDPSGFAYHQSDVRTPASMVPGGMRLTDASGPETRSLWFTQQQDISSFACSFTYRLGNFTWSGGTSGIALVFQNSNSGTGWVSPGAFPSNVGYAGLDHSAAITLEIDGGPGLTRSGYYSNGATGGSSPAVLPVNAYNQTDIFVSMSYNGSILTLDMNDGPGGHVWATQHLLVGSISSTIGSSSAFIGFTAGTAAGTEQLITDFHFGAIPTPGAMFLAGVACLTATRRRR